MAASRGRTGGWIVLLFVAQAFRPAHRPPRGRP